MQCLEPPLPFDNDSEHLTVSTKYNVLTAQLEGPYQGKLFLEHTDCTIYNRWLIRVMLKSQPVHLPVTTAITTYSNFPKISYVSLVDPPSFIWRQQLTGCVFHTNLLHKN